MAPTSVKLRVLFTCLLCARAAARIPAPYHEITYAFGPHLRDVISNRSPLTLTSDGDLPPDDQNLLTTGQMYTYKKLAIPAWPSLTSWLQTRVRVSKANGYSKQGTPYEEIMDIGNATHMTDRLVSELVMHTEGQRKDLAPLDVEPSVSNLIWRWKPKRWKPAPAQTENGVLASAQTENGVLASAQTENNVLASLLKRKIGLVPGQGRRTVNKTCCKQHVDPHSDASVLHGMSMLLSQISQWISSKPQPPDEPLSKTSRYPKLRKFLQVLKFGRDDVRRSYFGRSPESEDLDHVQDQDLRSGAVAQTFEDANIPPHLHSDISLAEGPNPNRNSYQNEERAGLFLRHELSEQPSSVSLECLDCEFATQEQFSHDEDTQPKQKKEKEIDSKDMPLYLLGGAMGR